MRKIFSPPVLPHLIATVFPKFGGFLIILRGMWALEYPHLCKELSSPRKGPRGFCGIPKVLRPCLLRKRLRLSRQEFKLHLQVAAFLARAVPTTPLPVAHEKPPEAIR